MKIIRFHRAVEKSLQDWPLSVKIELTDLLALLLDGQSIGMPASKPFPAVAGGVSELRIKDRSGQYRIFYFTKRADAILVFHAFKKKTQTTPKHEIMVAKRRLEDLL
jgi:phage-related protein